MNSIITTEPQNEQPNLKNVLPWTEEKYFKDTLYVTNTHLSKLNEGGPLHLLKHFNEPQQEEKDHHIWGSAFHCMVLEKEKFNERFFVFDDTEKCKEIGGERPRSTKKYQEWKTQLLTQNSGKKELNNEDYNDILSCYQRIMSIKNCRELLTHGLSETIFHSEILDVNVKGKMDYVNIDNYVVELKSMKEAPTPFNFSMNLKNYSWDRQAAFYMDILKVPSVFFIVVEKTAPFNVGVYEITEEKLKRGRENYRMLLEQYKMYFKNKQFNFDNFYYFGRI
jgi:hypothetical protein